jgi:hypothetical protein
MTADDSCGVSRNCHPPKTTLKTEILTILKNRINESNIIEILVKAYDIFPDKIEQIYK